MTITAKVEPSEDGHGFIAIVERDGKIIYSSETRHGKPGIFEDEKTAQSHADAWADCERRQAEETVRIRDDRRSRLAGEIIVLTREEIEDRELSAKLAAAARVAKDNADARDKRGKALAHHTDNPRLRIYWDRSAPDSVELQLEESEWDGPFVPEEIDVDDRQLSLPGTNWDVTASAGGVSRAIGHGRVEVTVVDGKITILLGAGEHKIVGKLDGQLTHEQAATVESAPKPSKPIEPKIGKLGDKALRERLPHITRAETLLGLYVLEKRKKKPRQRVIDAISNLAADHGERRLIDDVMSVDADRKTTALKPDLAAAALLTMAGETDLKVLEQLVPECGDASVLSDLLDDELSGQARDEVATVIRQRLAELAPTVDPDEQDDEPNEDQGELEFDDDYGDDRPRYDA